MAMMVESLVRLPEADDCPRHGSAEQAFHQLIQSLAAAASSSNNHKHHNHRYLRCQLIRRRLQHVLGTCATQLHEQRPQKKGLIFAVALARYLGSASDFSCIDMDARELMKQTKEELEALIAIDNVEIRSQYGQTVRLICSVAHYRSQISAVSAFEHLGETLKVLGQLEKPDWFGMALKMDTAFLMAHRTSDRRDLAFAESLTPPSETTRASVMFSGWRWEEGISEWVLPSPASSLPSRRTQFALH